VLVQRLPDGGHAAIHHVAGRDDVRPGFGVAQGGAGQQGQGGVIGHATAFGLFDDAAMAVAHVFAQANIRQHQAIRADAF
jgi:hypothetical protein